MGTNESLGLNNLWRTLTSLLHLLELNSRWLSFAELCSHTLRYCMCFYGQHSTVHYVAENAERYQNYKLGNNKSKLKAKIGEM